MSREVRGSLLPLFSLTFLCAGEAAATQVRLRDGGPSTLMPVGNSADYSRASRPLTKCEGITHGLWYGVIYGDIKHVLQQILGGLEGIIG